MGHVINGLVQEETQFRYDAELMPYPLAKIISDILYIGIYVLNGLLALF